ncbi:MAG: methyltransferase domain-containing protein [Chitinophagales bacterium]
MKLLSEEELIWSSIVANSNMNRERKASGTNSYQQEIKFKPEQFLENCILQSGQVKWLDICCGQGNALLQSARFLENEKLQDKATLVGVDLVNFFASIPSSIFCLQFDLSPLLKWKTTEQYDLITCIHGLHYVGDKLQILEKYLSFLSQNGQFIANLDLKSIHIKGQNTHTFLKAIFEENGIHYNPKTKIIECTGKKEIRFGLQYLGANDAAGPNYTGQEAVDSYYTIG